MSTTVKLALIASVVGVLLYVGTKANDAFNLVKGISYRITSWGTPRFANNIVALPLTIAIKNPSPLNFTVDKATVKISYWQIDKFIPAGESTVTDIQVTPGETKKNIVANVDLKAITSNALNTVVTLAVNRALNIKADVTLTIAGVTLPQQTFQQQINV